MIRNSIVKHVAHIFQNLYPRLPVEVTSFIVMPLPRKKLCLLQKEAANELCDELVCLPVQQTPQLLPVIH